MTLITDTEWAEPKQMDDFGTEFKIDANSQNYQCISHDFQVSPNHHIM